MTITLQQREVWTEVAMLTQAITEDMAGTMEVCMVATTRPF